VKKTGKELEAHPSFTFLVTLVKDDTFGVIFVKYATVLLQQMTIEIDEDFLFAVLDFIKPPEVDWEEVNQGKLCDDTLQIPEPTVDNSGQELYFEKLELQPLQFDLSFVRTDRVNVEDKCVPHQVSLIQLYANAR